MKTADKTDTFDSQPGLFGPTITVRPAHEGDFETLFEAASDPGIWAQHPSPLRYRREVFKTEFWDTAAQMGGLLMVLENTTGHCIGSSRFYQWNPADRSVVIGYTFLVARHWGGPTNSELKNLMLEHAFKAFGSTSGAGTFGLVGPWRSWAHSYPTNWSSRPVVSARWCCTTGLSRPPDDALSPGRSIQPDALARD